MPPFFRVETDAVSNHTTTLDDAEQSFVQHGSDFQSAMDDLIASMDRGAKEELQNLATQWDEANRQVTDAIREISSRVDGTAKDYNQGSDDQASSVRSKGSGLAFDEARAAL
ncbi:hypothetical protein [Dietzia cercidiphylli]|uniref:hypothetical protein n=1 Tax=Dietzia cercidiphylli TaxID=498199 RepID=UPI00223B1703|nr:hypothetical protein [Dietzia cercidiphylli]MCT1513640.1 hypothetical protein [Dietzia cercidiphylli]